MLEALLARSKDDDVAIAGANEACTYEELRRRTRRAARAIADKGIQKGAVVGLEGDYGGSSISLFFALAAQQCIIVPLTKDTRPLHENYREIAEVEWMARCEGEDVLLSATGQTASNELYERLRRQGDPGVVLFSSGSTGAPKAALQNLAFLARKFERPGKAYRTIVFLQFDHIGGLNTLLYVLSNGGRVIVSSDRSPGAVAQAIEQHRAQLLPTSPTFLNLLLLSGECDRRDLSSLELITYGTEPMPASTLERLHARLPAVKLHQTYGLTETGILRSESRGSDSLWLKVGGEGFETKIVDGRLWIRAQSAMVGYLNAPSPFDADGFLDTGDLVECDGDWIRILGRASEIINVGGNKVHPAEVEDVLLQMENVEDAVVGGEPNPIVGRIVSAQVRLTADEPLSAFKIRMRQFCKDKLEPYKIPGRVVLVREPLHSSRFKRMRKFGDPENRQPHSGQEKCEP